MFSGMSSINVYASDTYVDDNSDFDEVQKVLEQYTTASENGEVTFDTAQAKADGQSDFIIESGELINQVDKRNNHGEMSTMASLPIWGNWCGPGHGGGPAKDTLDAACKQHDLDYGKYGYFDCDSDIRLIAAISGSYSQMDFLEQQMAHAVVAYFQSQTVVNGCY